MFVVVESDSMLLKFMNDIYYNIVIWYIFCYTLIYLDAQILYLLWVYLSIDKLSSILYYSIWDRKKEIENWEKINRRDKKGKT